jgi:hypothetical protein
VGYALYLGSDIDQSDCGIGDYGSAGVGDGPLNGPGPGDLCVERTGDGEKQCDEKGFADCLRAAESLPGQMHECLQKLNKIQWRDRRPAF